jgi:hypothetical protein
MSGCRYTLTSEPPSKEEPSANFHSLIATAVRLTARLSIAEKDPARRRGSFLGFLFIADRRPAGLTTLRIFHDGEHDNERTRDSER